MPKITKRRFRQRCYSCGIQGTFRLYKEGSKYKLKCPHCLKEAVVKDLSRRRRKNV